MNGKGKEYNKNGILIYEGDYVNEEKTNRTRGKSINQRAMKKEYKMNSPFSTIKNLNKNLTNKNDKFTIFTKLVNRDF